MFIITMTVVFKVCVQCFVLVTANTVEDSVIVKKAGKGPSAIFQKVIVVWLTVPGMVSVCKGRVIAKPVGKERCAMKRIARTLHALTMVLASRVNATARLVGKDNIVIRSMSKSTNVFPVVRTMVLMTWKLESAFAIGIGLDQIALKVSTRTVINIETRILKRIILTISSRNRFWRVKASNKVRWLA